MMFDPTKPVQRRDGAKARIICTDRIPPCTIVALIGETEEPEIYYTDGSFWTLYRGELRYNEWDLVNV